MSVTIWHNPACGTSRNTLALIRATGTEPDVVLYLETPPSRAELVNAIDQLGIGARARCCGKRVRPSPSLAWTMRR